MRPVSRAYLGSNTAIRSTVTSWMAIRLTLCPQILSLDETAYKNKSVLFCIYYKYLCS